MATAQQELPLYGDGPIPNSKPSTVTEVVDPGNRPGYYTLSKVTHPTLTVFLPAKEKAVGAAVVICPGGGYSHLAMAHEGMEVAKFFTDHGIAAFVVKYRLPSDETMVDKTIGPLQDAQRAIQLVRQQAKDWGIDPSRIGLMGFSAGGHLASTAGTHFDKAYIDNPNNISLRPDFLILLYPVISMTDSLTHRGSRESLLGLQPTPQQVRSFSNEYQVTAATPPTFLVHAGDDQTVAVANSLDFYTALQQKSVPAEMHIYPHGGHGFGLHNTTAKDDWSERMINWMDASGWLKH